MAAIASPRRSQGFPTRWIVAGIGSLLIVAAVATVATGFPGRSAPSTTSTATVSRGSITATVNGIGTVAAAQTLDLTYSSGGTVRQVLVQAGDMVAAGQPIARLDDRAL